MSLQINEPTDIIAAAHARWKRNRDMVAGEDAVKAVRYAYLNKFADQTPAEYDNYVDQTPFFPAAARTHEGLVGLVTRKKATLDAPTNMKTIFAVATRSGMSAEEFAEDVFSEYLITGYPGILTDHPSANGVVTVLDAEAKGQRPFTVLYRAESILEVKPGIWANRQVMERVRLQDDEKTIRELLLVNGVYQVVIHRQAGDGEWKAEPPVTPLRNGKPLDEIPFEIASPKLKNFEPPKAPLDDVCGINVHIFRAQGLAQISRYFSAAPMLMMKNVKQPTNALVITPGKTIYFEPVPKEQHAPDAGYLEFGGQGQKNLDEAVESLKADAAKLGSNILANERAAAEAAETHAIRRSSENSVLAGYARGVSAKVEKLLDVASWWTGNERGAVKFALNTDFVPSPMTAQERTAALAELQAGAISHATFWQMLGAGEVLPADFDPEWERAEIAKDTALMDRPTDYPQEEIQTEPGE